MSSELDVRQSMEHMDIPKLIPDTKKSKYKLLKTALFINIDKKKLTSSGHLSDSTRFTQGRSKHLAYVYGSAEKIKGDEPFKLFTPQDKSLASSMSQKLKRHLTTCSKIYFSTTSLRSSSDQGLSSIRQSKVKFLLTKAIYRHRHIRSI